MRVNYFPAGSVEFASSRLRVYKVAEALRNAGHTVIFNSFDSSACDVAVFQKNWNHLGAGKMFKQAGLRIIFDIDDMINTPIPDEVDQITVDTPAKLEKWPSAVVIPDCLDANEMFPIKRTQNPELKRVVWFGNTQNMYHTKYAARACNRLGMTFTIITDMHDAHFDEQVKKLSGIDVRLEQWSLEDIDDRLIEHDLAVFPFVFDGDGWSESWVKSKSANRMLKAWALGLPVAATPIPSYVEAGLFWCAQTFEEWMHVLGHARIRAQREADVMQGSRAAQEYSADKVMEQWLKVFEG